MDEESEYRHPADGVGGLIGNTIFGPSWLAEQLAMPAVTASSQFGPRILAI